MKRSAIITSLTLFLTSLVSAGPIQGVYQLTEGLREIIYILIQFIGDIMGMASFDQYLFAKLLLFALILLVVYTVISKNTIFGGPKNRPIQWIISSAVSVLSIKYLPNEFVEAILLQYGAFAIGVTVFLPLLIYFTFIHQSGIGPFGRKIAWLVYIIGFFSLWSIRWRDLGGANLIYWIAIGFIIIAMIFDKTIHEHLGLRGIKKIRDDTRVERRVNAEAKLREINEKRQFYTDREFQRAVDHWEKVIKENLPK